MARADFRTEGAGAFLALFAYPMFTQLLKHGPAGMWGWVKAKWVNQPWHAPGASIGEKTTSPGQRGAEGAAHAGQHRKARR